VVFSIPNNRIFNSKNYRFRARFYFKKYYGVIISKKIHIVNMFDEKRKKQRKKSVFLRVFLFFTVFCPFMRFQKLRVEHL